MKMSSISHKLNSDKWLHRIGERAALRRTHQCAAANFRRCDWHGHVHHPGAVCATCPLGAASLAIAAGRAVRLGSKPHGIAVLGDRFVPMPALAL